MEAIRALMVAKRSARHERTQAINQARSLIVTGPDELRARFARHTPAQLVSELAAMRPRPGYVPGYATRVALRELGRRARFLDAQIEHLDELIVPLVTARAPGLLGLYGVGPDTAALLLIAAGDHPQRLRSEAAAAPNLRAVWHEAFAALRPAGSPDMRGMPDGTLLHLRDTYPIETAWAPQYVGDQLRRVRAAASDAHLAGLRAAAEAAAARQRGDRDNAARQQELAGSYQALHQAYRQREEVFAATMADRAEWDAATRAQRHLAVSADAELRRRHPGQHYPPLRSAEPQPATDAQRDQLTPAVSQSPGEMPSWIKEVAAAHRTFAERLTDRQSLGIPSHDPDCGDLGRAFPSWPGQGKDAILQPPKPEIPPSAEVLQRAAGRDADWEAAD